MAKRLLDCTASDFEKMGKDDLLFSIGASEGRVLACETIGAVTPLLGDVTNAELVTSLSSGVKQPMVSQARALPSPAPMENSRSSLLIFSKSEALQSNIRFAIQNAPFLLW